MTNFLFVYGTLKTGGGNNFILKGSKFIGRTQLDDFFMFSNSHFPYILHKKDVPLILLQDYYERTGDCSCQVIGEVYQVDDRTLNRVRQLEGVPHHYKSDTFEFSIERWNEDMSIKTFKQGLAEFYIQSEPEMAYRNKMVDSGYFNADKNSNVIWNVYLDEQKLSGTAPKIVSQMRSRSFDTDAKNVHEYMNSVKNRLQKVYKNSNIPLEDEGHFLNLLSLKCIIAEWDAPKNDRILYA